MFQDICVNKRVLFIARVSFFFNVLTYLFLNSLEGKKKSASLVPLEQLVSVILQFSFKEFHVNILF